MRIFHVSDTHLGYSAFSRLDPERGINQREADFYDSFERFIEISLREMPDIIVHAGDLFDSVRPSNRAISFALEQIKKIADSDIQFVAISGNHETPRLRETGSVFKILSHLTNCHFLYQNTYQKLELDGIEILCFPHCDEETFHKNLSDAIKLEKNHPRITVMHAGLIGLDIFRTDELNELILKPSDIDKKADYIALGHYHNFAEVIGNACYSGSTERLSISEAESEKGFIDIDLDHKKRKFVRLETRKMLDISPIDLQNMSASEASRTIFRTIDSNEIDGAIVRMTLKRLSRDVQKDLDISAINKKTQKALHFEMKIERDEDSQVLRSSTTHIGTLEEEFRRYLTRTSLKEEEKRKLENIASEFFMEIEE